MTARLLPSLVLTVGLLGVAPLALGSAPKKGYTATAGLTFVGTPGAIPRSADTLAECRDHCDGNGSCKGFSFDTATGTCAVAFSLVEFEDAPSTSKLHIASRVTPATMKKLGDFADTNFKAYDGPGHDIASFANVTSQAMCGTLCAANDACVAYTWRDGDDRCWLKDRVPALRQRAGLVTAYVQWDAPQSADYVDFRKVSMAGTPYRVEKVPLETDLMPGCARLCRRDDDCEVATVSTQGRRCSLFSDFDPASVVSTQITSDPTLVVPLTFAQTRRYHAMKEGERTCADQPGNDLASVKTESLRLCRATCAANDDCEAMPWNWSSKTCFMKSAASVPRPNANSCVSTTAWTAGFPY